MGTETTRVLSGYAGMKIAILDALTTLSGISDLSVFMESGAIQRLRTSLLFLGDWPGHVTFCR